MKDLVKPSDTSTPTAAAFSMGRSPLGDSSEGAPELPCSVVALGLDQRTRYALELLFKSKLHGRFVLAEADQADLCIIDLDSYGGRQLWAKQVQAQPLRPAILISVSEVETAGMTQFVRKPMRPQELITALSTAAAKVRRNGTAAMPRQPAATRGQSRRTAKPVVTKAAPAVALQSVTPGSVPPSMRVDRRVAPAAAAGRVGLRLAEQESKTYIGSAPDIDPKDREQAAKAQFDAGAYLIGKLDRAVKLATEADRPARLELDHGAVTIMPRAAQAVVDLRHCQLRALAGAQLTEARSSVRFVDPVDLSDPSGPEIWPLDALLWTSALLASRGRVPVGTDLNATVKLKRWPNLTRLVVFPNAVRITALLSREPMSLVAAARVLKIPQRFVFAFFTAAAALDLVEQAAAEEDGPTEADVAVRARSRDPSKLGLLRRILSHLRR